MMRRHRPWVGLRRQPTQLTEALRTARVQARLVQRHIAVALGVHPRTVMRWENGQTKPSKDEWTNIIAYLARFVPDHAARLAQLADLPSPIPAAPVADVHAIEEALFRAADRLDVSPRRVREAVREIVRSAIAANASLHDLAAATQDK